MLLTRAGTGALCALPGALTIYFAFNAGGFFPRQPAIVAVFLALTLIAWTTLADQPFAGIGPALGCVVGLLALYALWVLLSRTWSHAPGRSFVEFDRALLYLLAVVLFGSVATSAQRLRWMVRGLALAILVVGVAALATRLFPDHFQVAAVAGTRLSFPVTYTNALGAVVAIGIVLCLHLTESRDEPAVVRVLAAATIPLLSTVLYFTFGRGAIAVAIIGAIAYCLLARRRLVLTALIATVPATIVAIVASYNANLLASLNPSSPTAATQGHRLALELGACCVAAAVMRALLSRAEPGLLRYEMPRPFRRLVLAGLGGVTALAIGIALAAGAPHALATQYSRFIHPGAPGNAQDLRTRLSDLATNRSDYWTVALKGFRAAVLRGQGAGTFEVYWQQNQPISEPVINAHSLYFENLAELGIVGIGLLLLALIIMLAGTVRRARPPNRGLYAAVFCALLAWSIHAGADWDWQMPVVTFGVLSLGAAALGARADEQHNSHPGGSVSERQLRMPDSWRVPVAIGWLVVAVTPALISISHAKTLQAAQALSNRDCVTARNAAFSSIGTLGGFSAPYEIIGYCDLQIGLPRPALNAMQEAIKRDPTNWQYHEGLAIASAAAGLNPLPQATTAQRLHPTYDIAKQVTSLLQRTSRDNWPRAAVLARELMLNNVQVGRD